MSDTSRPNNHVPHLTDEQTRASRDPRRARNARALGYSYAPDAEVVEEYPLADAPYIIHKNFRPGPISSWLLKQSGGFDPIYYTKEEARAANKLAFAKFFAVTSVTTGLTIGLSQAFDGPIIKAASESVGINLKHAFMLVAAGIIATGVSVYDTTILHKQRYNVASGLKTSASTLAFRIGMCAFAWMISMPPVAIELTRGAVEQRVQKTNNDANAAIIAEHLKRYTDANQDLGDLQLKEDDIRRRLREVQNPGLALTAEQSARLATLRKTLETLEAEKLKQAQDLQDQEAKRDAASTRMNAEDKGVRTEKAGKGPKWREAEVDYNAAVAAIGTLQTAIKRNGTSALAAQNEVTAINTAGKEAMAARDANIRERIETTEKELAVVRNDVVKQTGVVDAKRDFEKLASQDPRFSKEAGFAAEARAFTGYMGNDASWVEWFALAGLLGFYALFETGVFIAAGQTPVNPGELRALAAARAKNEENEDPLSPTAVARRKRRQLIALDQIITDRMINEALTDPALHDTRGADIHTMFHQLTTRNFDRAESDANMRPALAAPRRSWWSRKFGPA